MAARTLISSVVFILLFVHVQCEEEQEANTPDNGTNANVIQFHYDKNSSQTFAFTTFASKDLTLQSFTVCLSLMVDALKDGSLDYAGVFQVFDKNGKYVEFLLAMVLASEIIPELRLLDKNGLLFDSFIPFHLSRWFHIFYSRLEPSDSKIVVGDGTKQIDNFDLTHVVRNETNKVHLDNITSTDFPNGKLGFILGGSLIGQITNLNLFSPALSMKRMQALTEAEGRECGLPGNFLSWEGTSFKREVDNKAASSGNVESKKATWTLHGKAEAKVKEGPCGNKRDLIVFAKRLMSPVDCIKHCLKIGNRIPSLTTHQDWQRISTELKIRNFAFLEVFLLPITKANLKDNFISRTAVWRDYYTGEQLENYTKPWDDDTDPINGTDDCVDLHAWSWKWRAISCNDGGAAKMMCPCKYDHSKPHRIFLRGLCVSSPFGKSLWYTPRQTPVNFADIYYVGGVSTRIEFNNNTWHIYDLTSDVTATSSADHDTFVLGKRNWTIQNDHKQCQDSNGQGAVGEFKTELKLTGCKQGVKSYKGAWLSTDDGEFTCNDGQCVSMRKRCDRLSDCDDRSDEENCNLVNLMKGYNKKNPPFSRLQNDTIVPTDVKVSMRLLRIVDIDEVDHTIDFQFEIILEWNDHHLTFNNLKEEEYLNSLTDDEIQNIWLPLLVYDNTDQKETTRLGVAWEWSTSVTVAREGDFQRFE